MEATSEVLDDVESRVETLRKNAKKLIDEQVSMFNNFFCNKSWTKIYFGDQSDIFPEIPWSETPYGDPLSYASITYCV